MKINKVFCIGFHKTGTTSLAKALQILGYKVTGPNGVNDPNIKNNVYKLENKLVKKYDAFQDNPWPIIYKELDKKYPKSKFILTTRSPDSWIKSIVQHFGDNKTPMREWIYGMGAPRGNESIYMKRYLDHNNEVKKYFENRPEDLLVIDLINGDGWDKLCKFLNKDVPKMKFPFINKAGERENLWSKTASKISRL